MSGIRAHILCWLGLIALARADAPPAIIDCHVHLWDITRPEGLGWIKKDDKVLFRSFLPAVHEPIAAANGVSGIVVVQAGQSLPDNQWNLDITAHNKSLYRGIVGNLSEVIGTPKFKPLFETLCKDSRYVGYRLSGRYQEQMTDAFFQDLQHTAGRGKTVDFLAGGYSFEDIAAIARRVPDLRIILDHFGGVKLDGSPLDPKWVAELRAVAQHKNVFCKVSALYGRVAKQPAPQDIAFYTPVIDLVFDCFGEDRLVFGSDWPVTETTGDYASVLKLTRAYFDRKGRGVSEKLFHKNAAAFYRVSDVTPNSERPEKQPAAPGTTRGIIDISKADRPPDAGELVGPNTYNLVPEGAEPTKWVFADGILTASPVWDSVVTKDSYRDFRMHVEFNVNEAKDAKNREADGNSGVYIQKRYEVQIHNSFGIPEAEYTHSYGGSIYRQKKPDRLVSRKAGEWQSYDIVFRAARFDGEKKTENARITVFQNGELIHDDYAITGKTGAGEKEGPEPRPGKLQGHHNPVRFRNVWIQKLALDAKPEPEPR